MISKTLEETKQHFSVDLPAKNEYYHLGGFDLTESYEEH